MVVRAFVALALVLSGSAPTCLAQSMSFDAEAVKDTLLMYERGWVRFSASNNSLEPFLYRPLSIDESYIFTRLYDSDGNYLRVGGLVTHYVPTSPPSLSPGETARGMSTLADKGPFYNKEVGLHYLPPGTYRATFMWRYDPFGRALIDGRDCLSDSIAFVVVEPEGGS